MDIYKRIIKIIKSYKNIVIARHISPDPDAIASQIALRNSIRLTFPNKNVYAIGAGVSRFKYLGELDHIDVTTLENVLLVVLDVPNFARVDGIEDLSYDAILKIDHHPAIDIIGDVDWTDETKSSTCEMLIELIVNSKLAIDQKIAEDLYAGLVFDNDRFLLSNTTPSTFETVSKLLRLVPINIGEIYNNLYTKKFDELKFHAYLINNIKITENGFGYIVIDDELLKKFNMDASSPSHFINEFYFIEELICWSFITYDERAKLYKVNIRSRGPIINHIAEDYNGGGHKFASGCRFTNKGDIEKLIKDLDSACKEYYDLETE